MRVFLTGPMDSGLAGSRGQRARWILARAGAAVVAAAILVGLVPSGVASAHATIESITPRDGTLVADAPAEVRVTFSEQISDRFIDVELVSTPAAPGPAPVAHRDPNDSKVLVVALPPLGDGLHQLTFSVRDAEDLHEVRGRTSFAVGDHAVAVASPPAVAGPGMLESVARWVFVAGLVLLAGVLTVRTRWPDIPVAAPARLTALTWGGMAAVLIGRLGVLVARALDLGSGLGDGLGVVATTGEMARLPVVIAALACLVPTALTSTLSALDLPVRQQGTVSFRVGLGWLGFTWLALLASWGDHAALRGPVEPGIALAKAVHLAAVAVWIGIIVVGIAGNVRRGPVLAALRAASVPAVVAAILTAASGFVLASRTVVSLTGLFATTFGRVLVAKTVLFAAIALLGLGHRLVRRAGFAVAEGFLLLTVAALGTAMATAGPATDDAYLAAPADRAPESITTSVGDVIVRSRAVPGQPGPNDLEIAVAQSRRPSPPIESVEVTVTTPAGPAVFNAVPDDRGVVVITGVELPEGSSELAVTVHRTGLADVTADAGVSAEAAEFHHDPIVSSAPIRSPLRAAALALGLVAVIVVVVRRRSAGDADRAVAPNSTPLATEP